MTITALHTPTLTAEHVEVTYLYGSLREVLLVPDEIARRMEAERRDGWAEYGIEGGESRWFTEGTWMHTTIATLMRVYADSPVPDVFTGSDYRQAARDRALARTRCELWPSIVGRSDWDAEVGGWRDYTANADLHVGGGAQVTPGGAAFCFTA